MTKSEKLNYELGIVAMGRVVASMNEGLRFEFGHQHSTLKEH